MALARDARSRRLDDWDVGSGEYGIGGCGARSRSSARPPTDGGSPRSRAGQRACARCERWYTRSGWYSRSSVRRTLRRRTQTAPVLRILAQNEVEVAWSGLTLPPPWSAAQPDMSSAFSERTESQWFI